MLSQALGQVIDSRHPEFAVGDFVSGLLGWQEYCATDGSSRVPAFRFKRVHPLPRYLGVLGNSGMTAYFGMLDVARPREGETVLVSGAAGATGSIAAQIAKIQRCRAIGIAGRTGEAPLAHGGARARRRYRLQVRGPRRAA